jgi:hypothetical protein
LVARLFALDQERENCDHFCPKGGRLPEEHISAEQQKPDLTLEITHFLLIDVCGYSKLLVNEGLALVARFPTR